MLTVLATEENILFMHEHIFDKEPTTDEIVNCAKFIREPGGPEWYAQKYLREYWTIKDIFIRTHKVLRKLRREHGYK